MHFSTNSLLELNCGAPYGTGVDAFPAADAHVLVDQHNAVVDSLEDGIVLIVPDRPHPLCGQDARQAGCWQWLQALVMKVSLSAGDRPPPLALHHPPVAHLVRAGPPDRS